jgi:outer membrane protein assembly factor BamB
VYLVSFDKIAVYEKNTMENIWLSQIDNVIESFTLIDGNNVLIVDTGGTAYAFNRNTGDLSWSQEFNEIDVYFHSFVAKPLQISNTEDRRLLTSVIIFPTHNEIHILDNTTGEIQFTLELDDQIFYISDYDPIDQAIYVTYGNFITKLILETR